jgi:5-formyltetrahydrofolate cyclo-ligase
VEQWLFHVEKFEDPQISSLMPECSKAMPLCQLWQFSTNVPQGKRGERESSRHVQCISISCSMSEVSPAVTKNDLRREMRMRLKTLGHARTEKSRAIVAALLVHPAFHQAETVALFAPIPSEPDIEALWEKTGHRFCYPRVTGSEIEFVAVRHFEDLAPASWNPLVREPATSQELVAPSEVSLILVPGLAFTRDGRRLGRGGGYYDRLLAQHRPHAIALGVCFDLQIVEDLPCEPHDEKVDAVVTENTPIAR